MAMGVCSTSISYFQSPSLPARTVPSTGGLPLRRMVLSSPPLVRRNCGFRWATAIRPSRRSGLRLSVRCGVETIGQDEFSDKVLSSELPVLVEFVAGWCGPCRLISPVVDWASQEYKDRLKVVKIDHDANPQLIEEYKVYGLPTLIIFKAGQEVPESRREGAMTKVKLKEYLDSQLESATVA